MQRLRILLSTGICICLAIAAYQTFHSQCTTTSSKDIDSKPIPSRLSLAQDSFGRLPLAFERNQGQTDPQVQFLSYGPGYHLFLTSNEAVLALPHRQADSPATPIRYGKRRNRQATAYGTHVGERRTDSVLRLKLLSANRHPQTEGLEKLPGNVNYFIGKDPAQWRTQVPTYSRVAYKQVYPGIDMVYYGSRQQLEYDWVVAPGADVHQIQLAVDGAQQARITSKGDLRLQLADGEVIQHAPVAYQEINGVRKPVSAKVALHSEKIGTQEYRLGFEVAQYDRSKPLVIDPVLVYASYLGGSGADTGKAVAVDSVGNVYVTGSTTSTNFPTMAAYQDINNGDTTSGDTNVFVYEMNASGTALLYATYLGGSTSDQGNGIAVDSNGNAYITGMTTSSDFPLQNALYSTLGSASGSAFVTKINAGGASLGYSTYLGGNGQTEGNGIAVDSSGNAYVTGDTSATNFPVLNALQTSNAGGIDAFVTKINSSGSALIYSTYIGGSGNDIANAIALDGSLNIYLAGTTGSTNFPLRFANQSTAPGDGDAFVTAINAGGTSLIYSTYLGGSGLDHGNGIAVDSLGNAYVTGDTASTNFPTQNAYQNTNLNSSATSTAFVTKFTSSGALSYSTYLGGSGGGTGESGHAIGIDSSGNAYVAGTTYSTNFPTLNPIQSSNGGSGDAFLTELASSGSSLVYSTYLGGSGTDSANGIAVDGYGNAYIAGTTGSTNFPIQNGLQSMFGSTSSTNSFVTRVGGYNWQAVDITVGSDQAARLVWTHTNQMVGVWTVNSNGVPSNYMNFGPFAGYTVQATAAGADGITRLLWNKSDGTAALWLLLANNTYDNGFNFGPYPGWRAADVAVGSDNKARLLWVNLDGEAALWTVDNSGVVTDMTSFGPSAGWTPLRIAAGSDGYTRVLWQKNDGSAGLWIMNSTNTINSTYAYGPYAGWRAIDLTVGSDNEARLLWNRSDGTAAIWTVDNSGIPSNYTNFGPYAGWTAGKLGSETGQNWLLWTKGDGTQSLWTLTNTNAYNSSYSYGPY